MRYLVTLMLLLGLSGTARTDTPPTAAADSASATDTVENPRKRSCRRVHVSGSHIRQKVCMTNARWAELQKEAEARQRRAAAASDNPGSFITGSGSASGGGPG